jgi:hypothetical protein
VAAGDHEALFDNALFDETTSNAEGARVAEENASTQMAPAHAIETHAVSVFTTRDSYSCSR